jgi:hypothetical protein
MIGPESPPGGVTDLGRLCPAGKAEGHLQLDSSERPGKRPIETFIRHGEPRRGVAIQRHHPLDGHGASRLAMTI